MSFNRTLRKVSSHIFPKKTSPRNDDQQTGSTLENLGTPNTSVDTMSTSCIRVPLESSPTSNIPASNTDSEMQSLNSPSNDIPRNILAFRTITTILAQIQQEQSLKLSAPGKPELLAMDRKQLKLLNAVSTLAVADHDVVAVVAKQPSSNILEVIACTSLSDYYENPQYNSKFSQVWHLLFTKNFRRDDPKPPVFPTIIDATMPAGLEPGDDEGLKDYIEKRWSQSTLADHLWILSKLLLAKDVPAEGGAPRIILASLSDRLLCYVIATCFPKMNRRLNNKTLSKPHIDSLRQVQTIPFNKSYQDATKKGAENDRLFLVKFLLPAVSANWLKNSFPNIMEQAKLAGRQKPFKFYTEDTCLEFHLLLLELLQRFQESLKDLLASRGKEAVATEGSDKFKQVLELVKLSGYALQRLAKGDALTIHLKTIESLLNAHLRGGMPTSMSAPKADMEEERDKDDGDYERDEELEAVQPFVIVNNTPMPLWQSYGDWLRLMVVHFDAVEILIKYVTRTQFPYNAISIKILVAPPLDRSLLPWRELFTDSKLFPTKNELDPLSTKTNDEILRFLESAIASKPRDSQTWARAALASWDQYKVDDTISQITRLKSSTLPGFQECAEKLLVTLRGLKTRPTPEIPRNIANTIQSLHDNATFFRNLHTLQRFSGTLHCEACLASLLSHSADIDKKYQDIQAQMKDSGRIIGVSKRCCPTCQHLLSLLTKGTTNPFLVSGSHSTVSACTLPTWLPGHIVDSMNEFFGSRLRRELIELMGRSELLRNRANPTGSERLSFDSSEGGNENIEIPLRFPSATPH